MDKAQIEKKLDEIDERINEICDNDLSMWDDELDELWKRHDELIDLSFGCDDWDDEDEATQWEQDHQVETEDGDTIWM